MEKQIKKYIFKFALLCFHKKVAKAAYEQNENSQRILLDFCNLLILILCV
jgi:hypothetical protein